MDRNAAKIFVILFTLTFMIDQYLVGRESLLTSLFIAAGLGLLLSVGYLFLKGRPEE